MIVYVGQAGVRNMQLPVYGHPARPARKHSRLNTNQDHDVGRVLEQTACAVYVRTSLCSSAEGRAKCDAVEQRLSLAPISSAHFDALPSDKRLPYDAPTVVSSLWRVTAVH